MGKALLRPWRMGTRKEGTRVGSKDVVESEDEKEEESAEEDLPNFVATPITVAYTEESIARRRKRVKGWIGSLRQTETMYMVSDATLKLPERVRKVYSGTSTGDLISGIQLPDLDKEWHVTWAEKKCAFGKHNSCGREDRHSGGRGFPNPSHAIDGGTCVLPEPT